MKQQSNKYIERSRAIGSPLFQQAQQIPLQHQQQQSPQPTKTLNGSANSKNRFQSSNSAQKVSYIDLIRSKSSTAESSVCSVETQRSSGRHNYSVSEFNRFKNKLLKGPIINSYSFDNVTNNGNMDGMNSLKQYQNEDISKSLYIQTFKSPNHMQISTNFGNHINSQQPHTKPHSQIRSIYESVQHSNHFYPSKFYSGEPRRSNLISSKASYDMLSNSLSIKKL